MLNLELPKSSTVFWSVVISAVFLAGQSWVANLVPDWVFWLLAGPGIVTVFINLKVLVYLYRDRNEFHDLQADTERLRDLSVPISRKEYNHFDEFLAVQSSILVKLNRLRVHPFIDLETATVTYADSTAS